MKDKGLLQRDLRFSVGIFEFKFIFVFSGIVNEPRCEKTSLRGFQPGLTQTWLCSYKIWLET